MEMRQARLRLKLRLSDLSKLTTIPIPVLSMLENGRQKPSARASNLIKGVLGNVAFLKGGLEKMAAPKVPEMRWKRDGKPDFTHLDINEAKHESVRDQLQRLIAQNLSLDPEHGDYIAVKEIFNDYLIYEVNQLGDKTIIKQSYSVENDKVTLEDDSQEARVIYETLSRRRIPKEGVPEPPTGHYTGEGANRRFVLNEEED